MSDAAFPSAADPAIAPLFRPFTCKSLTLPNRIVMAPMTRMMSPGGIPGADVAEYYARRAANEVGLIVTEGTLVHPLGSANVLMPDFWGKALDGWRDVVRAVHDAGGKIAPQLWHGGTSRAQGGSVHSPELPSHSPSGFNGLGEKIGPPMTLDEIEEVLEAFVTAARLSQDMGFDAIELHGAHGYLIDEFLWEVTNRRDDSFGGGPVDRTRFGAELVSRIRAAVGEDYPIIFRMSQFKGADYGARLAHDPEALGALLRPLADAGVDIFHCSTRRITTPEFEGSDLNLAGWVRKLTGVPTIAVGGVGIDSEFNSRNLDSAEPRPLDQVARAVDQGEYDLVAVGRALLTDPAWARKIREGRTDELLGFRKDDLTLMT